MLYIVVPPASDLDSIEENTINFIMAACLLVQYVILVEVCFIPVEVYFIIVFLMLNSLVGAAIPNRDVNTDRSVIIKG